MSVGTERVRVAFNPDSDKLVDHIKVATAGPIDLIELHKDRDPRLAALAQTAYEQAAMWGVKLATTADKGSGQGPAEIS
jgi:hypothetical protein